LGSKKLQICFLWKLKNSENVSRFQWERKKSFMSYSTTIFIEKT
jgi:hypothetical protein